MIKLFCYSDSIKYKTDKESEFTLFEMQATLEGLKIYKGDIFPFEISKDGKIILDSEKNETPLSLKSKISKGLTTIEKEKDNILALINYHFDKSFENIKKKYPLSEREGWDFLEKEAREWLSTKNVSTIPALHAECAFTKNLDAITTRAQNIITNSIEYKSFYGQQKARKNDFLKELDKADTAEKLDNLYKKLEIKT